MEEVRLKKLKLHAKDLIEARLKPVPRATRSLTSGAQRSEPGSPVWETRSGFYVVWGTVQDGQTIPGVEIVNPFGGNRRRGSLISVTGFEIPARDIE